MVFNFDLLQCIAGLYIIQTPISWFNCLGWVKCSYVVFTHKLGKYFTDMIWREIKLKTQNDWSKLQALCSVISLVVRRAKVFHYESLLFNKRFYRNLGHQLCTTKYSTHICFCWNFSLTQISYWIKLLWSRILQESDVGIQLKRARLKWRCAIICGIFHLFILIPCLINLGCLNNP